MFHNDAKAASKRCLELTDKICDYLLWTIHDKFLCFWQEDQDGQIGQNISVISRFVFLQ